MNRPSPAEIERVRRLLAHESGAGGEGSCATAAGRVYDKIHAHLAPLVGSAGVQALLVRSAKLTQGEFAFLEVGVVESSAKLRECLQAQEPAVATQTAAALFGAFFTLITTYIGERLTTQVLRRAWPTLDDAAPREKRT
jgi:hypothetical protein